MVAINKCDKAEFDLTDLKQELLSAGLELEEFGGDVQAVPISALTGLNLDQLKDAILTAAELADLRTLKEGLVEGVVIEANMIKGKGPVATILVQRGKLAPGAVVVAGHSLCKVKRLIDTEGKTRKFAFPSDPVQVSPCIIESPL